jgi:hypothetical protein
LQKRQGERWDEGGLLDLKSMALIQNVHHVHRLVMCTRSLPLSDSLGGTLWKPQPVTGIDISKLAPRFFQKKKNSRSKRDSKGCLHEWGKF